MKEVFSCNQAHHDCMETQTFAVAHLYKEEAAMDMHIHGCYEVYYSISGGRQFLIDNKLYDIAPGDLFIINQYESHKLTHIDTDMHERIILYFHPSYTKALSTEKVNLDTCFSFHPENFGQGYAKAVFVFCGQNHLRRGLWQGNYRAGGVYGAAGYAEYPLG